jgi:hypothetical protein
MYSHALLGYGEKTNYLLIAGAQDSSVGTKWTSTPTNLQLEIGVPIFTLANLRGFEKSSATKNNFSKSWANSLNIGLFWVCK